MDALLSDIRFAIRSLGKAKTSTAVALVSLVLGIGANVTVFSVVNALAFKPLPYARANRLVDLYESSAMSAIAMTSFAAFAILIAAIGLHGVIAYNTARRGSCQSPRGAPRRMTSSRPDARTHVRG